VEFSTAASLACAVAIGVHSHHYRDRPDSNLLLKQQLAVVRTIATL
jgi:hypothetical protein